MRHLRYVVGAAAALTIIGTAALPGVSGAVPAAAPAAPAAPTFPARTIAPVSAAAPKAGSAAAYRKRTLHLVVHIGPRDKQRCKVVLDLYQPDSATTQHPAPAILTTNGFAGSKTDVDGVAAAFAQQGYVGLAYSGLGMGGSSCRIELDARQWDGKVASQLVTFLGGGSRATNGTKVGDVRLNTRAADGRHYKDDPEVGMIGGSYGGGVQFSAAAVDPRIDAIVPIIAWNNLAYSLAPNNATLSGRTVTYKTPGIAKANPSGAGWLNLLWIAGVFVPQTQPLQPSSCPNYAALICPTHQELISHGYPSARALRQLKTMSISARMKALRIPVLLEQGENDSLFDLQEAVATYTALRHQHTPVKMVWQSWGHSDPTSPAGETAVLNRIDSGWFRYYLKHKGPKPALNFSFYRPWVSHAAKAFASAPRYPIGTMRRMYLSGTASTADAGDHTITAVKAHATTGSAHFTTPAKGAPESLTQDVTPSTAGKGMNDVTVSDPAGTFAAYESAPLTKALDVVGVPTVTVNVAAPDADLTAGPAGTLGLFFRLEDIAPNGRVTLPAGLISAARFTTSKAGARVEVRLPGIAHRFPAGHRIRLVIAGSDSAYSLPNPHVPVTVSTHTKNPGVLRLPVAGRGSYGPLKVTTR
jgi:predicted acyl esterase